MANLIKNSFEYVYILLFYLKDLTWIDKLDTEFM